MTLQNTNLIFQASVCLMLPLYATRGFNNCGGPQIQCCTIHSYAHLSRLPSNYCFKVNFPSAEPSKAALFLSSIMFVSVTLLAQLLLCLSDVTQCVATICIARNAGQFFFFFQILKEQQGATSLWTFQINRTNWQKHQHLFFPPIARTVSNYQPSCRKRLNFALPLSTDWFNPWHDVLSLRLGGKLPNISGDSNCRSLASQGQKWSGLIEMTLAAAAAASSPARVKCDVCSKCGSFYTLSANMRVFSACRAFQHRPLMDSSYSHIVERRMQKNPASLPPSQFPHKKSVLFLFFGVFFSLCIAPWRVVGASRTCMRNAR